MSIARFVPLALTALAVSVGAAAGVHEQGYADDTVARALGADPWAGRSTATFSMPVLASQTAGIAYDELVPDQDLELLALRPIGVFGAPRFPRTGVLRIAPGVSQTLGAERRPIEGAVTAFPMHLTKGSHYGAYVEMQGGSRGRWEGFSGFDVTVRLASGATVRGRLQGERNRIKVVARCGGCSAAP